MKTKRGIYLDLYESDIFFQYKSIKLYFSSKFYLEKFKDKYENYLKSENIKINNKYHCNLQADEFLIISLYKIIEKRGFRVYYNNIELDSNYSLKTIIK